MNKEMPNNTENELTQAITKIKILEQEILQGGNVDSEINDLEEIIKKLLEKKINPNEALEKANNLISRRQDYH